MALKFRHIFLRCLFGLEKTPSRSIFVEKQLVHVYALSVPEDPSEKDFLFFAIIEEIFDRFQLFAWKQVRPCDQFIHEKSFKPFFPFDYFFLFFAPDLNFLLYHPGREI
jgi:hypothetical protein